jgi:hypothetical protein
MKLNAKSQRLKEAKILADRNPVPVIDSQKTRKQGAPIFNRLTMQDSPSRSCCNLSRLKIGAPFGSDPRNALLLSS